MSFGAPFPGGNVVKRTFLDHQEITAATTAQTFSGLNFGTPSGNRYLVACFSWQGNPLASVAIGGIAATIINTAALGRRTAIAIALVPTGTSGNVDIVFTGSISNSTVALYSLTGLGSPVPTVDSTSVALTPAAALNIPANGAVIAVAAAGAGAPPHATWTGLTLDVDTNYGLSNQQDRSSASAEFPVDQISHFMSCTFSVSAGSCGCFAVFGP